MPPQITDRYCDPAVGSWIGSSIKGACICRSPSFRTIRARVLALDYRLVPEATFPAPVDDTVAAYRWLLGQGVPPARIVLAGDSAALSSSSSTAAAASGIPQNPRPIVG